MKSPVVQSDDYYPFGLAFNSYSRENSEKNNYLYNGKELQDELDLGWLDYGARMYMPEIGRWGVVDPKADKYIAFSPYNYVLNQPINVIDPDGKDVYFLIYDPNKEEDFKNALETRKKEIESAKGFNRKKDHVYVIGFSDLGKLGETVDEKVKDAEKNGYGKTVEASFFGHAGSDGPVGSTETSGDFNLAKSTGQPVDGNQLSMDGWNAINWNFDKKNSVFSVYGCNGDAFAEKFAQSNPDVAYAAGAMGRAGDTYSLDQFSPVLLNVFGRDSYIAGANNGQVLPTQVYTRDSYVRDNYGQVIEINEGYKMLRPTSVIGNVTIQNGVPTSGSTKVKE